MSEPYCNAHKAVEDELSRDKERLDAHSAKLDSVEACNIRLTTLIEEIRNEQRDHGLRLRKVEERPDVAKQIDDIDRRLDAIESRPGKWWDRGVSALIAATATFGINKTFG